MTDKIIKNAIIENATLSFAERGILTVWLTLDYGGSGQSFGGYALYLPKSFKHHNINSCAGHFIFRCMEIAGVKDWDEMKGKSIRVQFDNDSYDSNIIGIGHIIKEDWFYPKQDLTTFNGVKP